MLPCAGLFLVKDQVTTGPFPISLFGTQRQVFEARDLVKLIAQFRFGIWQQTFPHRSLHEITLAKLEPFAKVQVKVKELGCEIPEIGCESALFRSSLKC